MDVGTSPQPRRAGCCLHISSLPGHYGIGELGDNALRFVLTLESMGLSVWQVLPTGPTGFGDSPYQLQSTFAGNELLISVDTLLRAGWLRQQEVRKLRDLPFGEVDYGRLIPLKQPLLQLAAQRFREGANATQQASFNAFVAQHDELWLHDYALYRALKKQHDERPWNEWSPVYARRDASAIAEFEAAQQEELANIKVLQFMFREQWDRMRVYANKHGVQLLGDLPFYIAFDSADAWANPDLLMLDDDCRPVQVAGVPPDYFSADGQLWGNPVYDWQRHTEDNFAWWVERLRHALSLSDQVRIDHFRGFEAYWSIPADAATARDGEWLPGPGEDLFDALQAALGSLPIVAEDLGVITPAVDALREKYGLPGMKVLQFELPKDDFRLEDISVATVCYTGTHDNDTTLGWFLGSPDDVRTAGETARTRDAVLQLTQGGVDTVALDVFRLALMSPAQVAIAPLQDLLGLGSAARLNTPGSAQGNWRWRLLPELLTPRHSEAIRDMVRAAGRAETVPLTASG